MRLLLTSFTCFTSTKVQMHFWDLCQLTNPKLLKLLNPKLLTQPEPKHTHTIASLAIVAYLCLLLLVSDAIKLIQDLLI